MNYMKNIKVKKEKKMKLKEGDKIGGFYISSPCDNQVTIEIKEAIVRKIEGQLWAEHINPQYDWTEINDAEEWSKYLL